MGTQLLHDDLWKTLGQLARKTKRRRAAVAYFTTDLIGFRKGDLLVTDASEASIKSGSTSAKALRVLFDNEVEIRCCSSLHAKMLVFGKHAFVGSANLSESSRDDLNEAGLLTDTTRLVHEIEAAILRLADRSTEITEAKMEALESIKVEPRMLQRRTRRKAVRIGDTLGTTWLIHIYDEPPEEGSKAEAKLKKAASDAKALKSNPRSYPDALWYALGDAFSLKAKTGDRLITIWSETEKSTPTEVYRNTVITKIHRDAENAYISTEDYPGWRKDAISWKKFLELAAASGMEFKRVPSGKALKSSFLEQIDDRWGSK